MTDTTDDIGAAINALLKAGGMPGLDCRTPFTRQAMRGCMSAILSEAYLDGHHAAMETPKGQDAARIDWLATESDVHNLRAVVDVAMELNDGERAKE